jgi:hypothetical protein
MGSNQWQKDGIEPLYRLDTLRFAPVDPFGHAGVGTRQELSGTFQTLGIASDFGAEIVFGEPFLDLGILQSMVLHSYFRAEKASPL